MSFVPCNQRQHLRRHILCGAATGVLATPFLALAQQPARISRVMWISAGGAPEVEREYERRMEAKWKELGWTYGRNLQYDIRRFRGDYTVLARLAQEIAAGKYDVVIASENGVVGNLLKAGVKAPIVVQIGVSTVEYGLAKTLANPGGQVTGIEWSVSGEVLQKIPEFAKQVLPSLQKWGMVFDPKYAGAGTSLQDMQDAAKRLGLTTLRADASTPEEIEPAFESLAARGAQWVYVFCSAFHWIHMPAMNAAAARRKLPTSWPVRAAVEAGGLMSYGPDIDEMAIHSIGHADKILRGTRAGDIPIELPKVYELVISLRNANALGLSVPKELLVRADHVIT